MTLRVFLDTEYTDFIDPYLISVGMAAETGEEFYAEVPYPEKGCCAFVREAVIPLLGRIPDAICSVDDLRPRIWTWLELVRRGGEEVEICIDDQTDWDLFADALDNRVPAWCRRRLIPYNINEMLRFEFHQQHNLPEHHALHDARANRHAFRELPRSGN